MHSQCDGRRHLQELGSCSLWLCAGRELRNNLRQTLLAAILDAARSRNLQRHLAVYAHMAHGHATVRRAGRAGRRSHGARHAGKRRLRTKKRDHKHGDDLEKPLRHLE
jgi:hypothetical protein